MDLAPGRSRLTVSLAAACYPSHTLEHGMAMILLFFPVPAPYSRARHNNERILETQKFLVQVFGDILWLYLYTLSVSTFIVSVVRPFFLQETKISSNVSTKFGHIPSVFNEYLPFFPLCSFTSSPCPSTGV